MFMLPGLTALPFLRVRVWSRPKRFCGLYILPGILCVPDPYYRCNSCDRWFQPVGGSQRLTRAFVSIRIPFVARPPKIFLETRRTDQLQVRGCAAKQSRDREYAKAKCADRDRF